MSGIGRVVSVNVGQPRTVDWHGRAVVTSIWKQPVAGGRWLRGVNVEGDDQADRRVHGGPTKAVYAYASEDYSWWGDVLGRELDPGTFGENLTLAGLDPAASVVGEHWRVGSALVRVTEPRIPCFKLGLRMGDAGFVDAFAAAARPGTYLAIVAEGEVRADDPVEVIDRPDHGVTVGTVERAYHGDADLLARLVDLDDRDALDDLSDSWRHWARRAVARR